MQLTNILALFTGLAAASPVIVDALADGPSGHEVQITGLAFAGSGCPAGSVSGQLSSDLTTITLLYASFVAQAGNNIPASNYRKNCQLNVKLKYPSGWQFSVFKADYRGYAQIPKGDTGTCKATYYFSGDSRQVGFYWPRPHSCSPSRNPANHSSSTNVDLLDPDHPRSVRRQLPQDGPVRRREHRLVAVRRRGPAQHQLGGPAVAHGRREAGAADCKVPRVD